MFLFSAGRYNYKRRGDDFEVAWSWTSGGKSFGRIGATARSRSWWRDYYCGKEIQNFYWFRAFHNFYFDYKLFFFSIFFFVSLGYHCCGIIAKRRRIGETKNSSDHRHCWISFGLQVKLRWIQNFECKEKFCLGKP